MVEGGMVVDVVKVVVGVTLAGLEVVDVRGVVLDGASEVVVGAGVVEDGTRGSCGVTTELAAE